MSNDRKPDHVAGLAIQIPQGMIEDVIRAQMVACIPNPQMWVESIVRQACEEKSESYGKETKFGKAIGEAIRKECVGVFQEWIKQHTGEIRDALTKELTRGHNKRIKELAAKIADGMAATHVTSVSLSLKDQDGRQY